MASPGSYGAICDPPPCDPFALAHQFRAFGLLVVLIFAAAAFMSGRSMGRKSLALPILCMATIAAAMYLKYDFQLLWQRAVLVRSDGGLSPNDLRMLSDVRSNLLGFYARTYLSFSLIPFAAGALFALVQRRRARPNA